MKGVREHAAALTVVVILTVYAAAQSGAARPPLPTTTPEPQIFAEGTISTSDDERGITFTPDGTTAYFTKLAPGTIQSPLETICVSHRRDGGWTTPEVAPFSGRYSDGGAAISPDGSQLFFVSNRPVTRNGKTVEGTNLWVLEKTPAGWGGPRLLDESVNAGTVKASPSVAQDGTLYFVRQNRTPQGLEVGIYRSRLANGRYGEPEKIDTANTGYVHTVFVAPDESYLIFSASGGPEEIAPPHSLDYARGDLYVMTNDKGAWSAPRHLPPPINSNAGEYKPSVSPDGEWLYFTSDRGFASDRPAKPLTYRQLMAGLNSVLNGRGNIYRVEMSVLGINTGAH